MCTDTKTIRAATPERILERHEMESEFLSAFPGRETFDGFFLFDALVAMRFPQTWRVK